MSMNVFGSSKKDECTPHALPVASLNVLSRGSKLSRPNVTIAPIQGKSLSKPSYRSSQRRRSSPKISNSYGKERNGQKLDVSSRCGEIARVFSSLAGQFIKGILKHQNVLKAGIALAAGRGVYFLGRRLLAVQPPPPEKSPAKPGPALVWFRNDLRLQDHEPLAAACSASSAVLPVYVFDLREYSRMKSKRVRFLLGSIADLRASLRENGSDLVLRIGKPEEVLPALAAEVGASAVYCHEEVSEQERQVESAVKVALERQHARFHGYWGGTLIHPGDLPFAVSDMKVDFDNFLKQIVSVQVRPPLPAPSPMNALPITLPLMGDLPTLEHLGLSPDPATFPTDPLSRNCLPETVGSSLKGLVPGFKVEGGERVGVENLKKLLEEAKRKLSATMDLARQASREAVIPPNRVSCPSGTDASIGTERNSVAATGHRDSGAAGCLPHAAPLEQGIMTQRQALEQRSASVTGRLSHAAQLEQGAADGGVVVAAGQGDASVTGRLPHTSPLEQGATGNSCVAGTSGVEPSGVRTGLSFMSQRIGGVAGSITRRRSGSKARYLNPQSECGMLLMMLSPWLAAGCLSLRQMHAELVKQLSVADASDLASTASYGSAATELLSSILIRDFSRFAIRKFTDTNNTPVPTLSPVLA